MPMAAPSHSVPRLGIRYRIAGLLGFALALVLLKLPIGRAIAVVTHVKSRVTTVATQEEAWAAVAASRQASRWFPGRAACLENSLAATLTALLLRRRLDWCIGARLMPYAAHAWVETTLRPVGEEDAPDRPYLLLIRV